MRLNTIETSAKDSGRSSSAVITIRESRVDRVPIGTWSDPKGNVSMTVSQRLRGPERHCGISKPGWAAEPKVPR